jgi:hypothetical protein
LHGPAAMHESDEQVRRDGKSTPSEDSFDNHAATQLVGLPSSADLDDWCHNASTTDVIGSNLNKLFSSLCWDGKATELFRTILEKDFYDGEGELRFVDISPLKSDGTVTHHITAVGLKLKKDLSKHFAKIAPNTPDDRSKEILAKLNGLPDELEIISETAQQGPFHVVGWQFRTKKLYKEAVPQGTLESINRIDLHNLKSGNQYLYTQYITQPLQSVQKFNLITAGVKARENSFLITAIEFEVAHSGYAPLAEKRTKATMTRAVLNMFDF